MLTTLCDTNARHTFKERLKPAPKLSDTEKTLYATHLLQLCACKTPTEHLRQILEKASSSRHPHLGHMQCLQLLENVNLIQAQTTNLSLGQKRIVKLLCDYIHTNLYPNQPQRTRLIAGQRFFDNKENSVAYDDLKYESVADNVCRQIFDKKRFSFLTKDLSNCRISKVFIETIMKSAQQQIDAAHPTQPGDFTSNEEGKAPSFHCLETVARL